MAEKHTSHEILESEDFKTLARQKGQIAAVLTVLTLVVYYGFITLIAYDKEFFKMKILGVSAGIPVGIGVILASVVLTGIYVAWANAKYDAMVETIKQRIGDD